MTIPCPDCSQGYVVYDGGLIAVRCGTCLGMGRVPEQMTWPMGRLQAWVQGCVIDELQINRGMRMDEAHAMACLIMRRLLGES